jgi:hypothetical protein
MFHHRWATAFFVLLVWVSIAAPSWGDQAEPRTPYLFAYVNTLSVAPGENISLHLSSSETVGKLTIHRLGAKEELVHTVDEIRMQRHPIPDRASSHGCSWPATYTFAVPSDWRSGYYRVSLTSPNPNPQPDAKPVQTTCFFVVRASDPGSTSKILVQFATNTYNAYTNWGGHSLYAYHDRDGLQGHRVSFLRPIQSQFENWEGPFVRWAEANGYTLEFAVNSDLEHRPSLLDHYKLVLSIGHDEYWSSLMRDHLEAFIERGGNVAFFSGNTCCWQVRSEDEGTALTCWKQWYNMDPLYRSDKESLLSTLWSHHLVQRPENQLTGVGFLWGGYHKSHGQWMDGPASYEVHRPDHWIFAGTGIARGDRFGGKDTIVGYECDGCEMEWREGLPYATGSDGTPKDFLILGTCPATWAPDDAFWYDRFPKDRVGAAVLGTYTRGGTVITTGSTDWAHGLRGKDPVVEQFTKNVLDRLGK